MTATVVVDQCDGFARHPDITAAWRAWRRHPARRLMAVVACAQCGHVHVRRAD